MAPHPRRRRPRRVEDLGLRLFVTTEPVTRSVCAGFVAAVIALAAAFQIARSHRPPGPPMSGSRTAGAALALALLPIPAWTAYAVFDLVQKIQAVHPH